MKNLIQIFVFICLVGLSGTHAREHSAFDSIPNNNSRINILLAGGIAGYGTSSYLLYQNWYANHEQSDFHFFDDWGEWENMDKLGHLQASYMQSSLLYSAFRWAGDEQDAALKKASLIALGFQSTIEIMDGFSSKWGFSVYDFAFNIGGAGLFALQEKAWNEQRIKLKFSYYPYDIPELNSNTLGPELANTIIDRQEQLFGTHLHQQLLKDYNGQVIWISSNPRYWIKDSAWPAWLNIAIGYGANNMFGGYNNTWQVNGQSFESDKYISGRHQQYVIALDYDLSSFQPRSRFLKSVLNVMDYLKWPAPALELRSDGSIHFHLLFLN